MSLMTCTNDMKEVMILPKKELRPSQIGDSITLLYSDSSHLKVVLKANRMLIFNKNIKEPYTLLPKGLFVTFFDDQEKVSATLRANYGIRYDLKKQMEAKYAVELINKDGTKLETEKLIWNEVTQKIYTDAFVKITNRKEIIMGTGMESNQDFTKYEIKHITGQIQINTDEK